MLHQQRNPAFEQFGNNELIDERTNHHLEVIDWKVISSNQLNENPKCFFLRDYLKQPTNNHIESLAVVNLSIADSVSLANTLNCRQGFLANRALLIEKLFICKCSIEVFFYLVKCGIWKLNLL